MKLSIIIVSWNTKELTLKCLKSIFEYLQNIEFEVYLVDNNSSDGTLGEVEKYKGEKGVDNLHIIKNKSNLGFAKANNQAIRLARGEYILLLNSDTELLAPGSPPAGRAGTWSQDDTMKQLGSTYERGASIGAMIDFMERHPECGILGPQLLNTNGGLQRSCRRFPKLSDQLFIQLKFYNFMPQKIKATKKYFMLDFDHEQIKEVDQIMGAAMLIKKEVFDKIGLLDEKFWALFEEADFCKRAKHAGYKIYFYPDCQIMHHKEQSFKQIASLKNQMNFNHSLYHYFRKHKPFWQLIILWLIQPVNLFLTWIDEVVGIRKVFGKKKDL